VSASLLAGALLAVLVGRSPAGAVPAQRWPLPSASVFGLTAAGPDQGLAAAQSSARGVGRHLDVLNFYTAWQWRSPLPVDRLTAISNAGTTPEITWEPWDPRRGVDQGQYALSAIAGGNFDDYVSGWARSAAAFGRPLLLRFGHEMNGTWYPWSTSRNGGTGAGYVAAYRHVHDLFVAAGARNVRWVWSPATTGRVAEAYPGDAYVDIVGVDGYNGGSDVVEMGGWRSPQQLFGPTLAAVRGVVAGKPVWVNETGSSERGGDKARWVTSLFDYLRGAGVTGVVWFDLVKETDWRLASSAAAQAAATKSLRTW